MNEKLASPRVLLVVNLQEGLVTDTTKLCAERIKALLEASLFSVVLFSRFFNSPVSSHRSLLGWNKMSSEKECAIWNSVRDKAVAVFETNSHSALTPALRQHLTELNTPLIFLAGIETETSVLKTAADLFEIGIRPVVLADYCASAHGLESHHAGLLSLRRLVGLANILVKMEEPAMLGRYVEEQF